MTCKLPKLILAGRTYKGEIAIFVLPHYPILPHLPLLYDLQISHISPNIQFNELVQLEKDAT